MSTRKYDSESRRARAWLTRLRILSSAKKLFAAKGYDAATIGDLAAAAEVSAPTVYALFKSKEGVLKAVVNAAVFGARYQELVEKTMSLEDPVESLKMAPAIARAVHSAEETEMGFVHGAAVVSPDLKRLVAAGERQRYERQQFTVRRLAKAGRLLPGLDVARARDILWTMTSREIYRMLVLERGWTPDRYEDWLRRTLLQTLIGLKS